eukprot:TRINITY_DN4870_c0_g1_i1.p1 TRINITY_DN4870_c0_g1~~TRINITY_DN4870_c0_g1_i1.p1  ORF type:complete len:581 (+),score=138.59 TRINITY_DN4870_c0_g1_i1:32-1774(+)
MAASTPPPSSSPPSKASSAAFLLIPLLLLWGCLLEAKVSPEAESAFQAAVLQRLDEIDRAFEQRKNLPRRTRCTCYNVANNFCCWQGLFECENICYNGERFLTFGEPQCDDGSSNVGGLAGRVIAPDGPLSVIPCDANGELFKHSLNTVIKETRQEPNYQWNTKEVNDDWLGSRTSVSWRSGTTYLQILDAASTNIAHLIGKVSHILLVNNASVPAYLRQVDRFMLPRDPATTDRMRLFGSDGFHAMLLRNLLVTALQPHLGGYTRYSRTMHQHRLLGDNPMAYGMVEFELDWDEAMDERPMCFERIVYPGTLKAISYPGGPAVAAIFREETLKLLDIRYDAAADAAREGPPRLLYITRTNSSTASKRIFPPESKDALRALFDKLGFEVKEVDFNGWTFKKQVLAVHEADIIIGLHGAALVNAASFARASAVLIELMPYHIRHNWFNAMATNAGVTFIMHQLRQGQPTDTDIEYDAVTVMECTMRHLRCNGYYTQHRQPELTPADISDLEFVLQLAAEISRDAAANRNEAGKKLLKRYSSLCISQSPDMECQEDLLRADMADPKIECVLRRSSCRGAAVA